MDSHIDPQSSMIQAKSYLDKGDLESAEQHFIDAHENTIDSKARDSASAAALLHLRCGIVTLNNFTTQEEER